MHIRKWSCTWRFYDDCYEKSLAIMTWVILSPVYKLIISNNFSHWMNLNLTFFMLQK